MLEAIAKQGSTLKGPGRTLPFTEIYRATPADRIRFIKSGIPAGKAKDLIAGLHLDQHVVLTALNLKTATINRKAKQNEMLSIEDGERIVGLAKLVGQVEAMVEDAGTADGFDATEWLSQWLREPLPSLGGVRPLDLLDTMEGQSLVSQALAQAQSGAYA